MSDFKARILAELDTSKVEQQLDELSERKIKLEVDLDDTEKDIENVKKTITTTKKTTQSFGDALKKSFQLGTSYGIVQEAFHLTRKAANEATEAVKGFDDAVTDLRMATDGTYNDVSRLIKEYNQLGQSMGAVTLEVTDSANAFLRQGKTVEETNNLIRSSIILSKIGNIANEDATTYLTSSLNGFKLEAEASLDVVSKLAAVDLQSASDAGGIALSLSKTAASANMVNLSLDKTIGMIATIKEVTQDSDEAIGNAVKSMLSRINSIRAGKFVDEETGEALNDVEKVLNKVGISMRDANSQFVSTELIIDNINQKWSEFDQNTKKAIATAVAGTYHYNKFIALMDNYASVLEYTNVAANSVGTAEKKFNAYLDSVEAKTKSLQAAFEALSVNVISPDMYGDIIEATTALVTFLDKTNLLKDTLAGLVGAGAIKVFTLITTGITSAVMRMNEFNAALNLVKAGNLGEDQILQLAQMTSNLSQSQLKAIISSKALTSQQRLAILTAQGMSTAEAQAALASMGLATAEGTAATSTVTLTGTLKGLWATLKAHPLFLVAGAITAAVAAFSALSKASEKAAQEAKDRATESKQAADAAREEYDQLEELIKKYKELSESETRDSETRDEIRDIQNEINKLVGSQASNLDLVNGKLDEELDKLYKIRNLEEGGVLSEAISTATVALSDARNEFSSADTTDANWFSDGLYDHIDGAITIDYWGDNKERNEFIKLIDKVWEEKGYGNAQINYQSGIGTIDSYSYLQFSDNLNFAQRMEALKAAYQAIENSGKEGYKDNELYKRLVNLYDSFKASDGAFTKYVTAAENLSELLASEEIINQVKDVSSVSEYNGLINQILRSVLGNESVKTAINDGVLSEDYIKQFIADYLGSSTVYSEKFNRYNEMNSLIDSQRENLKKFWTYGDAALSADMTAFETWLKGLSEEDFSVVLKIAATMDTSEFTWYDWKNALLNYGVSDEPVSFAELITDTDKEDEFIDKVNNYIDQIEYLDEAYKSLGEDGYNPTELYEKFPELAAADDLGAAILQLKDDLTGGVDALGNYSGMYKVFQDQFGKLETDEDVAALTNFMRAVLGVGEALEETEDDLEIYLDAIDKITAHYDNRLKILSHEVDSYESDIAELEAMGYLASTKSYEMLKETTWLTRESLLLEMQRLQDALDEGLASGDIEEGDETWYSMQIAINDVKNEIDDANLSLIEYDKTMREIQWEHFDYLQERISALTDEADFLIDLLGEADLHTKNGQLTDTGMAAVGLHAMNHNTYMAQSEQYAQEILRINEQLAADPNNTELIARREELLGLQQDSILAAQDEKQAIIDLVQSGIEAELDALQELIDTYTDALDSAKDLYDYQKQIDDHTSEISVIRKQLTSYEGDLSEETKATIQKLKVELQEAEENLQETEYERYISDQKKLLDDLYTEYETVLNQRLDNTDALFEEMIGAVNSNASTINTTLGGIAGEVGYTLTDSLQSIWNGNSGESDIVSAFGEGFSGKLTSINTVLNTIAGYVATMVGESNTLAGGGGVTHYKTGGLVDYTGIAWLDGTPTKPEMVLNAQDTANFIALKDVLQRMTQQDLSIGSSVEYVVSETPRFSGISDVSALLSAMRNGGNTLSNSYGDINVTIPIEHVSDYNDFVNQLRNDPKFEKLIQSMTVNRIAGKNGLEKYKYSW